MTEVHLLAGDEAEDLYRSVAAVFTVLTDLEAPAARPSWLFEILLQAYTGCEAETLMERIDSLVDDHAPDVLFVIECHSPGSSNHVEARDRLYAGPEVLLVADLARHYPARLRTVAGPSDYSAVLEAMADELNGK